MSTVKPSSPPAPPPPTAPPAADLASYIEAQRRARGNPAPSPVQGNAPNTPPAETDDQRRDRIIASNLTTDVQPPTFGYDPKSGGGVFQLRRVGYDDAEFWFTGMNKDIGRRAKQIIEVRKGNDADVRIAVVRRMIAIIREEVQGDFLWRSDPSGRAVWKSARLADNQELEDFLMAEFFPDPRPPQRR